MVFVFTGFYDNGFVFYETAAGFLLPVIIALNPFLFSVSLNKSFKKLRCQLLKKCRNSFDFSHADL